MALKCVTSMPPPPRQTQPPWFLLYLDLIAHTPTHNCICLLHQDVSQYCTTLPKSIRIISFSGSKIQKTCALCLIFVYSYHQKTTFSSNIPRFSPTLAPHPHESQYSKELEIRTQEWGKRSTHTPHSVSFWVLELEMLGVTYLTDRKKIWGILVEVEKMSEKEIICNRSSCLE